MHGQEPIFSGETMSAVAVESSSHALSEDQVNGYWEKGWVALPGLFTAAEASAWDIEAKRLLQADFVHDDNLRTGFRPIDGKKMIERIDPVIDVSPLFQSVVDDPRILGALASIFRDEPKLFKDKLIFKLPKMTGYTMHQDQAWWQMCDSDDILSVSIAVDGASVDNGCIELFPGYHRSLISPKGELRNLHEAEVKQHIDETKGQKIATKPGDVLIFHSLAPHRSGDNTSTGSRRSLYLTYTAARSGNLYAAHRDHYKTYITAKMNEEEKKRKFFK